MSGRLARLPGVLLSAALLAAGCSDAPAMDSGPLGNGGIGAVQCIPGSVGKPLTLGLFAFHNSSSSAAVITRVDLAHPRGLRMLDPVIVPITTTTEIGNWTMFPPQLPPDLRLPWAHRRRAVGARLAPGRTYWNLVFGLQPTTRRYGRSDGVDLWYTEGGQRYHLRTGTRLVVAVGSESCLRPPPAAPR